MLKFQELRAAVNGVWYPGRYPDPTGLLAVGSRRETEIAAAAYIAETGRGG